MKTLVVLTALVAVAVAGPRFRADDSDLDTAKEKRSPTFGSVQHLPLPIHHHQPYVQPIIPHHLGLKKPLIVHQPYGHHGHIFRSDDEQLETHSAESKESKNTCMKEMEAKCDDEISGKSSESEGATKVEDIDGSVSDSEVAQSLKMAKDAVDTLQKKLQLAEKNPKMTQWKHGESEIDGNMHENIETAKLALEQMQRNFGNLESMNVHAKNAEVHEHNLKLESAFKNSKDLKTDEERLAQWKDAIETIQKNVELVRNIEDSFQNSDHSEKSAALEKSSSLKHEISRDPKEDSNVLIKEKSSDMKMSQDMETKSTEGKSSWQARENDKLKADDLKMAQDIAKQSTDGKSSWQARENEKLKVEDMKMSQIMEKKSSNEKSGWQAREHEKPFDSNSEMETSASTLSESKTTLQGLNDQVSRSGKSQLEKDTLEIPNAKSLQIKSSISQSSQPKSNEISDMKQAKQAHIEIEMDSPVLDSVDTTNFMKSADHSQAEQHKEIEHFSSNGHSSHKEHDLRTQDHHKMSAEHHEAKHSSHMGHNMNLEHAGQSPHMDHTMSLQHHHQQKSLSPVMHPKEAHETGLNLPEESRLLDQHKLFISSKNGKDAHEMTMKSSDQLTGQSQLSEMAAKHADFVPSRHHSDKLSPLPSLSHSAHGKSAEGGSMFAPIGMNSDFKEAIVPMKSWKEAQSGRGAYGLGGGLSSYGSGYGAGSGSGSGSGAVGVFPSAHVGGCAIPLLLSCSPNVVAGHLAKSHSYAAPSYGASGYRGSENLSSHAKRDITKISHPSKINQTTNKGLKHKTVLITDTL